MTRFIMKLKRINCKSINPYNAIDKLLRIFIEPGLMLT
jgi:hypothetical protein